MTRRDLTFRVFVSSIFSDLIAECIQRGERAEHSLGNVDAHNAHFIGRTEELRRLRETVALGKVGVLTAVHGLGGMGKTARGAGRPSPATCLPADMYRQRREGLHSQSTEHLNGDWWKTWHISADVYQAMWQAISLSIVVALTATSAGKLRLRPFALRLRRLLSTINRVRLNQFIAL